MVSTSILVVRFEEVGIDDVPIVGGKGASLGELTRAGIPVPEGFVLTTHAFRQALTALDPDASIEASIAGLHGDESGAIEELTAQARERIASATLSEDLDSAVRERYRALCAEVGADDAPVAVRSSATSEDSADASFAGLQATYLWVQGEEQVVDAVRRCWASLYSVESVTYRRRRALPEDGLAMAVVVQRMVDARSSGVMFTRSPVTGDRSVVAVDASWGLGSAVVSGEVTPDSYVLSKITGEVLRKTIAVKTVRDVPSAEGSGVRTEPVPDEIREAPALEPPELAALLEIARKVERHYGCPQDIEWAVSESAPVDQNIFLLQSRPETVWAEKESQPVAAPKDKAFDHVVSFLGAGSFRTDGEEK